MRKPYTLRMRPSRMNGIKVLAEKEGTTATAILESAAERYLEKRKNGGVRQDIRRP